MGQALRSFAKASLSMTVSQLPVASESRHKDGRQRGRERAYGLTMGSYVILVGSAPHKII